MGPGDNLQSFASSTVGLLLVGAFILFLCTWNWPGSRRSDMPPGPRPLPILGNLLDLKPTHFYEQLRQLNTKYGSIASLKLGSGTMIVIGGDGAHVHQLLNKRGSIYSGRPLQMATEIAGRGDHFLFQRNRDKWRIGRKYIVQHFAPAVMKSENVALQEAESVQLLHDFLNQSENFMQHAMRYTTSVLTCLAYGVRCEKPQDPAVHGIEGIMRTLAEILVTSGKPPVEFIPWLNYVPEFILPWRARCEGLGKKMDALFCGLAEIERQRGMQGLNTNNLAYKLHLAEERTGMTQHEQAYVCGIVMEGGTDIVAGVILTCLLALVHDPVSQKRAQDELDAFYGEDTLPQWQHEHSFPFVRAVIKEAIRWRVPLPMAVGHELEQDDYYEGYFLPKGSTVVCNTWAIHNDSGRFDEPEKFKPERFLDHSMSMAESVAQGDPFKRDHFAFGAGRRVCPGIQTAEQDIFIAISQLLWAFNFSAPPGANTSADYHTAFIGEGLRYPVEFPLVTTLRSDRRAKVIENAMTVAKETFSQYGAYTVLRQ